MQLHLAVASTQLKVIQLSSVCKSSVDLTDCSAAMVGGIRRNEGLSDDGVCQREIM